MPTTSKDKNGYTILNLRKKIKKLEVEKEVGEQAFNTLLKTHNALVNKMNKAEAKGNKKRKGGKG